MTRPVAAAAALVVLVNALALAGVAWNRSGEPEAQVELTAREFWLPWRNPLEDENSGLSITLSWNNDWLSDDDWLDAAKLRELGFDTAMAPGSPEADEWYRRQAPRRAFVALEMDGDSWSRWLAHEQEEIDETAARAERGNAAAEEVDLAKERLERNRVEHSRLFAIDAALDASELRGRHADRSRVFILPARVSIEHWGIKEDGKVRGRIDSLLISTTHVPLQHRAVLDQAIADREAAMEAPFEGPKPPQPPSWAVTLAFGRRLEPWIVSVRPLRD
ncbi:MAG: DUF4824 family protein [Candidatus Polarisedimenticolia bacterium]